MSRPHLGFKVKQHNPWRVWIGFALVILLLAVMFLLGRAYQGYELDQLKLERETLYARIAELEQRNDNLVRSNAQLSSANKIEHDAYEQANQELVLRQREILQLKEQLVFYQGIVSPEQLALGINVQSFEISKKNDLGLYAYKLVLTKRGKSNQYVKGGIEMLLKGQQRGEQQELTMKQIKQDYQDKDFNFTFRYFQVFEGDILLPDGFEPYDVELEIKPKTSKIKNFTETISWAQALPGGND